MSSPDQWLENAIIFGVYPAGGGGGGGVTAREVQEFAFNYEAATGVDDAFVVNLSPAVTVLTDGLIVSMSSGALQNNTDSPTLQINALTPVDIVLWAGALAPGDIEPGASYMFIYNEAANSFELINPSISTANAFLVQENAYNAAIDSGAANAYEVTLLVPPLGSFGVGFPVYMKVAPGNTNTGASTLTVNGETDAIVLNSGAPVPAGVIVENAMAYLLYNGTNWVLINPAITGDGFVQSVTGADADQVIVDNTDPENPILSLPQDIAPTSSPEFFDLILSNGTIFDEDAQAMASFSTRADSISSINFSNATDGGTVAITIVTTGLGVDVPLSLSSLGDAGIKMITEAVSGPAWSITSGNIGQHTTNFEFANTAETRDVTWQDADGTVAFLTDIPGGVLAWSRVSGTSQACDLNNGYISLNSSQTTFDLPATAPLGSVIAIQGQSEGGWIINANTGQIIFGGSERTSSGGNVTSQAGTDNIYLLCVEEDIAWRITTTYSQGLTYA